MGHFTDFPPPLDRLFGVFGESGPLVPMLYSVDLFVLREQTLYRVVPGAELSPLAQEWRSVAWKSS